MNVVLTLLILFSSNFVGAQSENLLNGFEELVPRNVTMSQHAVGRIYVQYGQAGMVIKENLCTGFLIASDVLMTNAHCDIGQEEKDRRPNLEYYVMFLLPNRGRYESFRLVRIIAKSEPRELDILLFQLEEPVGILGILPLPIAPIDKNDFPKHPWAITSFGEDNYFELDHISQGPNFRINPCSRRSVEDIDVILNDCKVRPGNSGSPIVNHSGEVVGIIKSIEKEMPSVVVQGTEWIVANIKSSFGTTMKSFVDRFISSGVDQNLAPFLQDRGDHEWDKIRVGGFNYEMLGHLEGIWPKP